MKNKTKHYDAMERATWVWDSNLTNQLEDFHEGGSIYDIIMDKVWEKKGNKIAKQFEDYEDKIYYREDGKHRVKDVWLIREKLLNWWIEHYPQFAINFLNYVDEEAMDEFLESLKLSDKEFEDEWVEGWETYE